MSSTTPTELSLFHKILILVEDRGEVTLEELNTLGPKRQTLGALGRLEGLGYIKRTRDQGGDTLALTETGDQVLSDILEFLPNEQAWDGRWRMILFDIPESKRTARQMFRLKLIDLGARMFHSSVWLTPHEFVKDKFENLVKQWGYTSSVHYFDVVDATDNPVDVEKLWHLKSLEKDYRKLFNHFEQEVKKLARNDLASYYAKCHIVSLALIARKDPQLPSHFMPSQWIGSQASEWHDRLRGYCQN